MKILVVEDEKRIAEGIKTGLELHSHVIDVALNGREGLDLALSEQYDVMILDWMVPEVSGLEICQAVREEGIQTPVLFLTAKSQVEEKIQGLDVGADDYLTKPFSFSELVARVKALGRRAPLATTNILTAGNLTLNLSTYAVFRGKKQISLSRKEFSLLEFFLRHEGQVLSATQILEQVWSFDSDVLPNTVQVYVGYLRSKIDKALPNDPPLIHTVRGFGYTFGGNPHV